MQPAASMYTRPYITTTEASTPQRPPFEADAATRTPAGRPPQEGNPRVGDRPAPALSRVCLSPISPR
eukprot:contig_4796_g1037